MELGSQRKTWLGWESWGGLFGVPRSIDKKEQTRSMSIVMPKSCSQVVLVRGWIYINMHMDKPGSNDFTTRYST